MAGKNPRSGNGLVCGGQAIIDFEQIRCGAMDTNAVFHQEHHKLFSVHQGDGGLVGLSCFLNSARAEVAGSDDQALFVRTEASPHLLDHRGLDIVSWVSIS